MKRQHPTRAGIMLSLAFMALLGGYGVGAEPPFQAGSLQPEAATSQIVEGSKVTLQYVTRVPGSAEIDYGNISEFIQGQHEIFPAVEREIVGMKAGEEKSVRLTPEDGFGPHDDRKKLNIPKKLLPSGAKEGDVLQNDAGELATVAEISERRAVLDYNHPLAGKQLVVQVKILKVENP